jgi:hypothetical protein
MAVAGLHASMRIEETLLRNRLSAIEVRVQAMVEDLRAREKKLLERMDDMLGERSETLCVCVCVCLSICAFEIVYIFKQLERGHEMSSW